LAVVCVAAIICSFFVSSPFCFAGVWVRNILKY
jgi:hypothetical protein